MKPSPTLACAAVAVILVLAAAAAPTGGPDGSATVYRWADSSYSQYGGPYPTYGWANMSQPQPVPGSCAASGCMPGTLDRNEWSTTCVPFGFPVTYYGRTSTCAWVHSDGVLNLGSSRPAASPGTPPAALPSAAHSQVHIAGYWADLLPGFCSGQVLYGTIGTAPTRTFIVEYRDVPVASSVASVCLPGISEPPRASFQVQLRENADDVQVHLRSVGPPLGNTGFPALLGIQSPSTSHGLAYGSGTSQAYQQLAIRYYPNHAPDAGDDAFTVREDSPQVYHWLGTNDRDQDWDWVSLHSLGPGSLGTAAKYPWGAYLYLIYTPKPDAFGTDPITYVASDPFGFMDAATATITITPVNDAPTLGIPGNVTVGKNAGQVTLPAWATLSPGPPNEAGQTLQVTLATSDDALFRDPPQIGLDGTLTFMPRPGAEGTAIVTVVLQDDGGTLDGGTDTVKGSMSITIAK